MTGVGGLALALALGGVTPLAAPAQAAVPAGGHVILYASVGDTIIPVDTVTRTAQAPLPVKAGFLAITPNGATLLAVDRTSATITPIDTATRQIGAPFAVSGGSGELGQVAVTPDGTTAWLTRGDQWIVSVNLATHRSGTPIAVDGPVSLALTPDGRRLLVTSLGPADGSTEGGVTVIDTSRRTAGPLAVEGDIQGGITMAPGGRYAWVADTATVYRVDTTTGKVDFEVPAGEMNESIAITPNGSQVWFTDFFDKTGVIDVTSRQQVRSYYNDFYGARDVAITPDGRTAWFDTSAPHGAGLVPVDTGTLEPGAVVTIGEVGVLVISPAQAPTARFGVQPASHGALTRFDGSASTAVQGRIVRYAWRFGDGTSARTSSAVIGHAYARAGTYSVQLTVTDSTGTSTSQVFTGQTMNRNGKPRAATIRQVVIG